MERRKGFAYNHRNAACVTFSLLVYKEYTSQRKASRALSFSVLSKAHEYEIRVANKVAPVRRWYVAYFSVQNFAKILKENLEKKKTAEFRKRVSAKTAVFSVFKSVK